MVVATRARASRVVAPARGPLGVRRPGAATLYGEHIRSAKPCLALIAEPPVDGPYVAFAMPAVMRVPPPPLADQAVLLLRRLAAMQQDVRDVMRAGRRCSARLRLGGRREPREVKENQGIRPSTRSSPRGIALHRS